jgi:DNA helicase II / ATP-dependent DNA helicase PcrA
VNDKWFYHSIFLMIRYSKKIIGPLLKQFKDILLVKDITLKESAVLSLISKSKSKGITPEAMISEQDASIVPPNDIERVVALIYVDYERILRKSNALDFDDLLLFCVKLFNHHREAVRWCQHILVDELCAFFRRIRVMTS